MDNRDRKKIARSSIQAIRYGFLVYLSVHARLDAEDWLLPDPALVEWGQTIEKEDEFAAIFGKTAKCKGCTEENLFTAEDPEILVFMSFSVPKAAWLSLSEELDREGGVFVIRGLPKNSFRAFAERLIALREEGVLAPIQLDPKAFRQHEITAVPAVVLRKGDSWDKVTGNVSLRFALDQMKRRGDVFREEGRDA